MLKLLSKRTFTVIAIASVLGSSVHFAVTSGETTTVNNHKLHQVSLETVWDRETEPNYVGTKEMIVYRSPSCGCCGVWIEHAKKHGFQIQDIKIEDMQALKQKYDIPTDLVSCHTTIIDGYVIEGHVPADDIKRFLVKKPDMIGLSVPGMPIGTPGMEAKDIKQPFQVLAFNDQGDVEIFTDYQSY